MGEIFLYHGSAGIIKAPVYGKGNGFNDYGCGFYCTGDKELAKEWACAGGTAAFVRAFLSNKASFKQLKCSILSDSCKQFVLKSEKALESLRFVSYEPVPMEEYYAKRKSRDEAARAAFQAGSEKHKRNGLYIQDLIREEVRPDDPRIQ